MEAVFAAMKKTNTGDKYSVYLEEPEDLDPHIFNTFKFSKKFLEHELVCQI
jgi:hypothetical protein